MHCLVEASSPAIVGAKESVTNTYIVSFCHTIHFIMAQNNRVGFITTTVECYDLCSLLA